LVFGYGCSTYFRLTKPFSSSRERQNNNGKEDGEKFTDEIPLYSLATDCNVKTLGSQNVVIPYGSR